MQDAPKTRTYSRAPKSVLETSRTDAVADELRKRGVEPGYEAVASFAPPLKYVSSDFKIYPLVLGEKDGTSKVRLLADGSELHLGIRYDKRHCGLEFTGEWFGAEFSAALRVGSDHCAFSGKPSWQDGYLPEAVVVFEYQGTRYTLRAFAAMLPCTTERLCAWLAVEVKRLKANAPAEFQFVFRSDSRLAAESGYLFHPGDNTRLLRGAHSDDWVFDQSAQALTWKLPASATSATAYVVLADQPAPDSLLEDPACDRGLSFGIDRKMTIWDSGMWMRDHAQEKVFRRREAEYLAAWKKEIDSAPQVAQVQVPEEYVNSAHKNARVSAYIIANRDQMNYSVHNWYERMYGDESAQASIGLAFWGHFADAARYLGHSSFYTQVDVTPHDLGTRLHWLCRYITLSNDTDFFERNRARMARWAKWLIDDIQEQPHGLGTPTGRAGDLHTDMIYSLASNCDAWRGIRDFGVLTNDSGLLERAEKFRAAIRRAAEASIDRSVNPPFLSTGLFDKVPTPDSLRSNKVASYWGLMAPYSLYANALGDSHPGTRAMIETFRQRCGLCAGLVRFGCDESLGPNFSWSELGIDDLYGAKLSETFARMDDPEQLVLALYGKLGLGLTPNTFVAGEGASLVATRFHDPNCVDGRIMHLPPNSASQMFFATLLRHCLVFDLDSREDGNYDTLRLAFSTPREWLNEGKSIRVKDLPTAFGPVSYTLSSSIKSRGVVDAELVLPTRQPAPKVRLRLRTPMGSGQGLRKVTINGKPSDQFDAASQTVQLDGAQGRVMVCAYW